MLRQCWADLYPSSQTASRFHLVQRVQKPLPYIYLYIYKYIYDRTTKGFDTKGIVTKGISHKRYRQQKVAIFICHHFSAP